MDWSSADRLIVMTQHKLREQVRGEALLELADGNLFVRHGWALRRIGALPNLVPAQLAFLKYFDGTVLDHMANCLVKERPIVGAHRIHSLVACGIEKTAANHFSPRIAQKYQK